MRCLITIGYPCSRVNRVSLSLLTACLFDYECSENKWVKAHRCIYSVVIAKGIGWLLREGRWWWWGDSEGEWLRWAEGGLHSWTYIVFIRCINTTPYDEVWRVFSRCNFLALVAWESLYFWYKLLYWLKGRYYNKRYKKDPQCMKRDNNHYKYIFQIHNTQ